MGLGARRLWAGAIHAAWIPFLAAAVMAAVWASWRFLPEPIVQRLYSDAAEVEAPQLGASVVNALSGGVDSFATGSLSSQDQTNLRLIAEARTIFSMTLWSRDGTPLWSLRPESIPAEVPALVIQVLASGTAVFEHLHLSEAVILRGGGTQSADQSSIHAGRDVNHFIIPITSGGTVIGVVETFQDVTLSNNSFIDTMRSTLLGIGGLIGGAALVALYRIRRSSRVQVRIAQDLAQSEVRHLNEQMRLGREVRLLGDLNEWLQSSKSLDELFFMVTRFLTHLLPNCAGSIYVYSNSRDVLDGAASWNGGHHLPHIHPEDCWGLRRGRTYTYGKGEVAFKCAHVHDDHTDHYLCIPFLAHGETVGMMHLRQTDGGTAEQFAAQKALAQMCAEQVSLAIANVRMRDELQHQAIRDALTGLYNRRHMLETLRRQSDSHRKGDYSVISIDVDHFKLFNDNHGHDAGDVVLRSVAEVMIDFCDGGQTPCRMGGEELMILLPDTALDVAVARAEDLRQRIQKLTVRYGEKSLPEVTVSIGVAQFPLHGQTPQDVIRAADDALYVAKARGRNCVVPAGQQGLTQLPEPLHSPAARPKPARPVAAAGKPPTLEVVGNRPAPGPS
jgi:diguanylate cyclase (GGDEF)-like protein